MPCNSNFHQNFKLEISLNENFKLEITLDYFFKLQLTLNWSLNYSEPYFELDSEEATHCRLICCVYIKGHVETVNTKDQSNAIVYWVWYLVCRHCWYKDQSKQAMHLMLCLSTLSTLVFVALTQHLMQVWKFCIKWPLTPARREGCCVSLPSWGFSCSPVSPRRQLCKLSWTRQTTRVIAGKMHSQSPILKTKGCSTTR